MASLDQYAVAIYDYEPNSDANIKLYRGETVRIHERKDGGWWSGEAASGTGWFPESYVTMPASFDELLEPGWIPLLDPSTNQTYYMSIAEKESSWERPVFRVPAAAPAGAGAAPAPQPLARAKSGASFASSKTEALSHGGAEAGAESEYAGGEYQPPSAAAEPALKAQTVNVEGREFAVDALGRITFCDNFWGDAPNGQSGFDLLTAKTQQGTKAIGQVASWIRQRAAIEERYAKELERLAKSNLGEAEEGTMKTAWNQVKFDAENTARAHAKLALALNNEILGSGDPEPVVEANRLLRDYESAVGRDRKRIAAADQEVEKTRKTYISRMTDAERAGPSSGASSSRASLYGAPVSQSSERKKATLAANEYRRTVDEANEARRAWGDTVNLASLEYQNLEIRRINYLKQLLDSYLDTLQASRQSLEESSSMVRNSIQAVSTDVDIEMFVKSRGTGPHRPKPVEFHPFK